MAYILGVDIGTSFTAAAVRRVGDPKEFGSQVLTLGSRSSDVPSVFFFGDDGQVLVGEVAERRGLDRPDLVVREFKRRIGDSVPIVVGEQVRQPEALYAQMARWVVDRAEEREGGGPEAVILTHPASWGDYKTALVRAALEDVGLGEATLLSEPEAAALQYASQERLEPGSTVAVYDFGGGTFDVAIVRKSGAQRFTVLGQPEGIEHLGGADFDQAVFEHVVGSAGEAFRNLDIADPDVLAALARVRRECVEAKEALSYDSEASIPVLLPGARAQVRLVRSEFEAMIQASVAQTIVALTHSLHTAGCEADDLDAILLVGGSSRVPLIAQMLSGELDRPIAIDADPKASICLGATIAGAAEDSEHALAPVPLAVAETSAIDTATDAPADATTPQHVPRLRRTGVRVTTVAAVVASLMVLTGTASHFAGLSLLAADASADTEQVGARATDAPAEPASDAAPPATSPTVPATRPTATAHQKPGGAATDDAVPSPSPELYEAAGSQDDEDTSEPAPPLSVENASDVGTGSEAPPPPSTGTEPTRATPHPTSPPAPSQTPSPSTTPTPSPTQGPTPAPPAPTPGPTSTPTAPPTADPAPEPAVTPPPANPPAEPPLDPPVTDDPAPSETPAPPAEPGDPAPIETAPPADLGTPAGSADPAGPAGPAAPADPAGPGDAGTLPSVQE